MKLIAGLRSRVCYHCRHLPLKMYPLRLPSGVTPTAYRLALTVDPNQERHQGRGGH
ncbi:hypothetical protein [Candidatus Aalborgicola defluviihabitans]|uniref:hypothetical protein n=1 Tax=Candidatus Aalborgicola defluviihabitans TaxID=3386187 RepID=UPI001DB7680E|nr:hypothetical protein [Burkholderiales bacterium]